MEKYKKTLRTRILFLILALIITAVVAIFSFTTSSELADSSHFTNSIKGMCSGMCFGFFVMSGLVCFRYFNALRNEETLNTLYIQEHDERKKAVRQSALEISYFITIFLLIIGIQIAGVFNNLIAITLFVVLFVHALTGAILKAYFHKKY